MLVFLAGPLDDKLFNLRRLQAKSKMQTDVIDQLLYADDMAENAKTETKRQGAMDRMSQACTTMTLQSAQKD